VNVILIWRLLYQPHSIRVREESKATKTPRHEEPKELRVLVSWW
jgi:hypothetical protein